MTRSSPWRGSQQQLLSSPDRAEQTYLSDFLADDRNNELSHRDALAAAQAEHERVREAALRVIELHEMKEEHRRIVEAEKREHQRLEAEARIAAEEKRLQELKAKSIPKPTPPPPSPPAPPAEPVPKPAGTEGTGKPAPSEQQQPKPAAAASAFGSSPAAPQVNGSSTPTTQTQTPPAAGKPFGSLNQPAAPSTQPNGVSAAPSAFGAPSQPKPAPSQAAAPRAPAKPVGDDQYIKIHKELKRLRTNLQAEARVPGSPMKAQLGTLRREIRVSIGQLTSQKGANSQPINKIIGALRHSLDGKIPSPPVDVSLYVTDQREPTEGAVYNDATMPGMFIYLINITAKGIINQFINECGANPKAADPIGVVAAHIFSSKEFHWRGKSIIDILLAKFRVVCPVLFGYRAKDTTVGGRLTVGWKKDGASWVPDQTHRDRMAGLGAGYASLSLRDFSKSSKLNPYPPTHYWKALAFIVNTPAEQVSDTQLVVLRAMIEGHEQRFLNFYGNAGLAALRTALVDFPKKAPPKSSAAGSLQALAELLRAEQGLVL